MRIQNWFFFATLLSFSFSKKKISPFNETNPSDPLFEQGSYCDSENCIPIGKSNFHKAIQSLSKPERVREINNYIRRLSEPEKPEIKAILNAENEIKIVSNIVMEPYRVAIRFDYSWKISAEKINTNAFKKETPFYGRKLPLLEHEDFKTQNILNVLINLLLHMNNLEFSLIKEEFYVLPIIFKDCIFTANQREIQLLKNDGSSVLFKEYREYFTTVYKEIMTKIKYKWKKIDYDSAFPNGIDKLDVAYAFHIIYRNYQKPFISILFSNNFDFIDTMETTHMTQISQENEADKGLVIRSLENYDIGDPIRIPLGTKDPDMYFSVGNSNYLKEGTTCIALGLVEKEEAEKYGRSAIECIGKKNLDEYVAFTNVMNMNKTQTKRCQGIVRANGMNESNLLEPNNLRKAELIINKCDHPEWKRDFISFFKKQIVYKMSIFQSSIEDVSEYISLRKSFKKSIFVAEKMKEFYEFKLHSAKELETLFQEVLDAKKKEMQKNIKSEL